MSTWQIDQAHTEIGFKVKHLMISTVRGHFTSFKGSVTASSDDFSDGQVALEIDVNSITTNQEGRDGHLKSPDFFDVAKFPTITFISTAFTKNGSGYTLTGDFTMHGVTKSVAFDVTMNGITKGMDGKRVAVFEAKTMVNRLDFDLKWNAPIEMGGFAVGDDVAIEMLVEIKEEV